MNSDCAKGLTAIPCTAAQYRDGPESTAKRSLIGGLLIEEPAGSDDHQGISIRLSARLYWEASRTRAGVVREAPYDVWLNPETVVQPDVLFVSKRRAAIITQKGIQGAPDLVVEILSPSTARLDRVQKRALYAQYGVSELWLIDPERRQIEVYRFAESRDRPVETLGIGDRLASPILPNFEIVVADIFQD